MSLIVGRSFATSPSAGTCPRRAAVPSVTVTVIVAVPNGWRRGHRHRAIGPAAAEHDVRIGHQGRVRRTAGYRQAPAAVSTSPTVKASAPVFASSLIVWSAMSRSSAGRSPASPSAGTCPWPCTVRVADRDGDRGRPVWFASRGHRHRAVRPAAAEHDVGVGHQRRVRRTAASPSARRRLHVAHRERERARVASSAVV